LQNNTKSVYDRLKNLKNGTLIKVTHEYIYTPDEVTIDLIEFWIRNNVKISEQ
jgi:hypothetical protein